MVESFLSVVFVYCVRSRSWHTLVVVDHEPGYARTLIHFRRYLVPSAMRTPPSLRREDCALQVSPLWDAEVPKLY